MPPLMRSRMLTYADIRHASFVLSEQLTRERDAASYALTYADIRHASFVLSEQLTRERDAASYALTYAHVEAVCSDLSLKLRFRA
jgi:hypothetical protein